MPQGDNGRGIDYTIEPGLTLAKLFLKQYKKFGRNKVAMREKEFGIWRPITWEDYYRNVKYISLGLVSLGLEPGDKVSMIGDNRPQGLWAEMGAICAGGVGVWLFQDCLMEEVKYIIDHSDTKFLVGEGQEEVDKALAIRDSCPKLKKIIWDDPKGLRNYHDPMLISLEEVMKLGKKLEREDPEIIRSANSAANERVRNSRPTDLTN
ncbi:MAG: AMP-binding protein [Deltaproteobacteria bacterium]|nr:AMP-binding protein [Deltaproteobacteria bacterium]